MVDFLRIGQTNHNLLQLNFVKDRINSQITREKNNTYDLFMSRLTIEVLVSVWTTT
tara:strand:+ start:14 stop:181 length:168 start_codon:yes stop_codon:yes gene_type:complete